MDSRNKRSDKNSELYRAITALDSLDDCYDFLVDLCTQPELKAMEQRYEVARRHDLQRHPRRDERQLRNHQPREPLPDGRYGRL